MLDTEEEVSPISGKPVSWRIYLIEGAGEYDCTKCIYYEDHDHCRECNDYGTLFIPDVSDE